MDAEIKKLLDEQKKSWQGIEDTMRKHDEELEKLGAVTGDTKEEVARRIEEHGRKVDEVAAQVKKIDERQDKHETKMQENLLNIIKPKSVETPSKRFTDSEEYKTAKKMGRVTTDWVNVDTFYKSPNPLQVGVDDYGGTLVGHESLRVPGILHDPGQELRIRDLLNVTSTSAGSVEFVQEIMFADEDSEGNIGGADVVSEMEEKPGTIMKFQQKIANPAVIATHVVASRQILSDVSQLRSHIDNRLIYSLKLKEEQQILYGSGVNPNLEGLTINAADYDRDEEGDTDIDTLRRSVTQVMLAGYPNTGFVLHPVNWERIELHKDGEKRYLFSSPHQVGQPRIWGYPVVQSQQITPGDFLAGAFGLGAQLFDLWQAQVRIGEQHSDFMTKNMVLILAEERLILAIYRPKAFVYGGGDLST